MAFEGAFEWRGSGFASHEVRRKTDTQHGTGGAGDEAAAGQFVTATELGLECNAHGDVGLICSESRVTG
jgi:hypothetical protein